MKRVFTPQMGDFIRNYADGHFISEITEALNKEFGTSLKTSQVKTFMARNKIHNGKWGNPGSHYSKRFPKEVVEYAIEHHKGIGPTKMAELLNEKFGTDYTKAQINNLYNRKKLDSGLTGRFEKGHIPACKGKKWDEYMSLQKQENSRKTCYKKGNIPVNHRHVGSIRITPLHVNGKDGQAEEKIFMIKVCEPNKWVPLHRLNYEAANGPIPKNYAILFGDRNSLNPDPENLVAVPRSILATLNRHGYKWKSKEELETYILLVKNKQALSGIKARTKKRRVERWKSIPGFGCKYEASTQGRIKRFYKNGNEKILQGFRHIRKGNNKDDLYVRLADKNGNIKEYKISLLVYRTWAGEIYDWMNIVHTDGNRTNNDISNLVPVSKEALGKTYGYKSRAKAVVKCSADGIIIKTYRSAREAARENGMSYQTVMDRCNGKIKRLCASDGCIYKWQDEAGAKVKMC